MLAEQIRKVHTDGNKCVELEGNTGTFEGFSKCQTGCFSFYKRSWQLTQLQLLDQQDKHLREPDSLINSTCLF